MIAIRGSLRRAGAKISAARARQKVRAQEKLSASLIRERERIAELKRKRKFQQTRKSRRKLERQTGTGVRGFIAGAGRARESFRGIAGPKETRRKIARRAELGAFSIAGISPPKRLTKPIKVKRKKRKRKKAKRAKAGKTITIRF